MLASCTVFYEAHDEAIAFFGLNYDGRDSLFGQAE
jgi:hypothetical protein